MNKKGNYEDCLKFIENKLDIHLLDFQKELIKAHFENRIVVGGRGIGRTMCKEAYGKYIDSLMIDETHADEAYIRKIFRGNKVIKLFTHTDLDGIGCAVLAKLAFGNDVNIEYCNYDDINTKVEEYFYNNYECDTCHITDISINEEIAYKINDESNDYVLLDHHATALGLNKFYWCTVKVENEDGIKTSGTELYYHYLIDNGFLNKSDVLDKFINLVRNYDTWRWATLGDDGLICKKVNDLLYLYGRKKFITWCISEIHDGVFPRLYASDELVLRIKQKEIDDYVEAKNKQIIISELCGRTCGFVFAEKYSSELGNRLCQMHPEIDFVAMINMDGIVSYRTIRDDVDLGKDVAKLFGGGGHPKAAGSQMSKELQIEIIEMIFEQR